MKVTSVAQPCILRPSYGVQTRYIDDLAYYVAEHSDPQFELELAADVPMELRAGHYEFTFSGTVASGSLTAPCLYIDYGSGYSEGEGNQLYLTWKGGSFWTGTILLTGKSRHIRFDPSIDVFESASLGVTVRKVGGARPFLYSLARSSYRAVLPKAMRQRMAQAGVTQSIAAQLMRPAKGAQIEGQPTAAASTMQLPMGLSEDYWARISSAKGGRHPQFGAISARKATDNTPAFKPIAYYLPQMHPFPENDAWWGRGFTEWTNVSKAVAQFRGHYQPKLPGELGFYDLRVPETMARQIELAKLYGLHGFCFYYYWFGGKRLLEKPVEMFLDHQGDDAFDMPFCLCWANENWTRRWDGAEHEVLMAQTHTPDDHLGVIDDLIRHFRDKRYITVEGRPVILLYRPMIIPDLDEMLTIWRKRAVEMGFPGLFIVATNSFGFDAPEDHGFDALCGFPPHGLNASLANYKMEMINSNYSGWIFEYAEVVDVESQRLSAKQKEPARDAAYFPGLMVAWDNEARKPEKGNVFHDSTPALYRQWLARAAETTAQMNPPDRRFLFINAWNEWAEGAYLEPDRRFGYGYLAATADVVREMAADKPALQALAQKTNKAVRKSDTAVCLHLFYPEMIEEFAALLKAAKKQLPFDLLLTVPDTWTVADTRTAITKLKPTRLIPCPNRGRDVLPFLTTLREGLAMGYTTGCKLHSKKSPQHNDGDAWRHRLVDGLLGPAALKTVAAEFQPRTEIAIAAPEGEFAAMSVEFVMQDNLQHSREVLSALGHPEAPMDEFVAGTMFWFRFAALEPMAALGYTESRFGPEIGQLDGTLAHAFERIFVPYVKAAGHSVLRYPLAEQNRKEETSI